jgi:hypothetical protein
MPLEFLRSTANVEKNATTSRCWNMDRNHTSTRVEGDSRGTTIGGRQRLLRV